MYVCMYVGMYVYRFALVNSFMSKNIDLDKRVSAAAQDLGNKRHKRGRAGCWQNVFVKCCKRAFERAWVQALLRPFSGIAGSAASDICVGWRAPTTKNCSHSFPADVLCSFGNPAAVPRPQSFQVSFHRTPSNWRASLRQNSRDNRVLYVCFYLGLLSADQTTS